jgi:hypothetical protein
MMFRMLVRGALLGHCGTLVVGLRLEQAQGDSVGYAGLLDSKAVQRDLSTLNYFPAKWVGLPYGPVTTNAVKAGIVIATLGVDADRTVHLSDVTRGHPGSLAAVVDRSPAPDILTEDKELEGTGRTGQTRHGVHRSVRAFSRPPQRPFWTQH